jgi:predicted RNase H-like HicB family nuclease
MGSWYAVNGATTERHYILAQYKTRGANMAELEYTYTEEPDGWFVGYLNLYPDCLTQGKDLAELETMLVDVYTIMRDEEARYSEIEQQEKARQRKGILNISAEALA